MHIAATPTRARSWLPGLSLITAAYARVRRNSCDVSHSPSEGLFGSTRDLQVWRRFPGGIGTPGTFSIHGVVSLVCKVSRRLVFASRRPGRSILRPDKSGPATPTNRTSFRPVGAPEPSHRFLKGSNSGLRASTDSVRTRQIGKRAMPPSSHPPGKLRLSGEGDA